ncbi:MAG: nucleotidyltransferase domain-containing protein [Lachnospiraceae bacterium]|nr:nucleotidyltransferase domain-containing protein [Lachnospiraceae bacterium]
MSTAVQIILSKYVNELEKIYGTYLKEVILYGSYARGDFSEDSDIDIMILLDLDDMLIKKYRHELSGTTYDFNMDYNIDIKPIAKSKKHFEQWVNVYPFYKNIKRDGVLLLGEEE